MTGADDAAPHEATAPSMYPLSTGQQSWWVAQQLQPTVPLTVAMYLDLSGPLEVARMARCARRAARELQSPQLRLRTVEGQPRQYVDHDAETSLAIVDLRAEADPVATAIDTMERDYGAPLDPLEPHHTVATLFQVATQRHLLYLRSHHIVLDGLGAAALLRRIGELYRAEVLAAEAEGLTAEPDERAESRTRGNGSIERMDTVRPVHMGRTRSAGRVLWRSANHVVTENPEAAIDSASHGSEAAGAASAEIDGRAIEGGKVDGRVVEGGEIDGRVVEGGAVGGGKVDGRVVEGGAVGGGKVDGRVVEGGAVGGGKVDGRAVGCGAVEGGKLEGRVVGGGKVDGRAVAGGKGAPAQELPALTVPEILEAERAYRDSPRRAVDREYWLGQLDGLGAPMSLAGRPAPAQARPHRVTATVDAATAELLADARSRHGATFPELALAAFACFLARMTARTEVTLTLPVPARTTAGLRRSAGSMSNVVPLRLSGLDTSTVGAVIAQVRSTVIGALRHQRYRFEDMHRDSGRDQALGGGFGPLVNVLGFAEPFRLGELTGQVRLLALGPVEDLMVNGYQAGPDDRSISIDFQANPARYRYDTVAWQHRMFLAYFARFLGAETDCPIMTLDHTVPAPTATPPAGPVRVLPDLLRASVARDGVAVRDGDRAMSYRELDEQSSRLARELMAGGARPGEFVVVAVPRSLESVLALWAVAKSGACFVPVDPSDPVSRIAAVIADSQARQGITVEAVRERFPSDTGFQDRLDLVTADSDCALEDDAAGCGIDWLVLDDPRCTAEIERRAATPVDDAERPRALRPAHSAYLIYTSGTTGRPKGVAVSHRGLGSLTDYIVDHWGVGPDSVVLHSHAPSFDAHLLDVLAAFASGARLVVQPPEVISGAELARLLRESGCTHYLTTPAVLATLSPAQVPDLEVVAVGGEACPAKLVREWAPHVRLFNGYGPTEATVMATETAAMSIDEPVTVGHALPGVLAVVLDSRLGRLPDGARGELYLGGIGVADCYVRDPAGTAVRFIADPFGVGQRLYRTGDLVSAGPDGAFEFLGRVDAQVEVRGRRIEPAEIEAALLAGPEIAYAVVTVADAGLPEARLVGYVVAAPGMAFDAAATRQRLRGMLPAALVPSALIELDRLPVASNGKLDRRALPPPVIAPRPYRAPETVIQRLVAEHIGTATGQAKVGLNDDFFELGGNSLLGVAVSAELAAVTGVPVTVRWLYTTPTVLALAERITTYDGTDTGDDDALGVLLALRRNGTRAPLFCVHSAVPLAWCYAGLARYVTDRPVYGLQAPTLTGPDPAIGTIDELADSYVDAMLRVQPEGPYHLLGWSLGGQIAHAIAVRLRARGASVAVLAMLDSVVFPDGVDPPPAPRMRDLLTHLLGDEPEDGDSAPELTAAEAADELARAGASFGTGLSATQLERLHRGYVDGVALSHGYRPGVFDGDLLYFSATRGVTEWFGADLWRPFVTGDLIEHPVAATHAQLTNAAVVAVIGPILARHLEHAAVPA
ncbi:enterobactin synthetase component F [Nocardia tenerifensis]|uniref:Enterobactin synthetase component F n=1 Tax=Nocardia tenerifensis TaxID=228006 RepID=A0A318KBA7_9NOCA|nr:enterobactin synthetase component F [Nocardia tenerifensis]